MNRQPPKKSDDTKTDLSEKEKEFLSSVYCDVCFLAFGSQESRLKMQDKTIHLDCSSRIQ